ncbi:MAG: PdaC/SigV domain-containing protein [Lysobacter sp.]
MRPTHRTCALTLMMLVVVAACDRGSSTAPLEQAGTTPAATEPSAGVELADVMEATSDYVIGISYPQSAARYPALAAEMKRYAEAARADLMRAVEARRQRQQSGEGDAGSAMYDLSLTFTEVLDSPDLVAYAADGSSYTGGAHGTPLLQRFVWLPQLDRRLTAEALVPQAAGWQAIANHVREQLYTALSQRVEADDLAPAERADVIEGASRMIEEGTAADPENYSEFEPMVSAGGRVTGLRFVFAPYQVGPYSDGTQTVEVPASVLLPHVAPEYRELFAGGL